MQATRDLCGHAKTQLQLDALQSLSAALLALPQRAESAAEAFARVKAQLSAEGAAAAAERDRLEALQTEQLRRMSSAVVSADVHRVVDAMNVTGEALVQSFKTLERLRAAAVALMHVADDAFIAGDDAALIEFVAAAYPPNVLSSLCTRMLQDMVAALQGGFGNAAGLGSVSAALQLCGTPPAVAEDAAAVDTSRGEHGAQDMGGAPRPARRSAGLVRCTPS